MEAASILREVSSPLCRGGSLFALSEKVPPPTYKGAPRHQTAAHSHSPHGESPSPGHAASTPAPNKPAAPVVCTVPMRLRAVGGMARPSRTGECADHYQRPASWFPK